MNPYEVLRLSAFGLLIFGVSVVQAATPVATYQFNNSLAADEAGAPNLMSVTPLGLNGFEDAVVNGVSDRVFHWQGHAVPTTEQAGLTLDATGLVQYNNYSVKLIFEFLEPAQAGGGWRRIMDTQSRQSDNGFYVDPGNRLQVYPVVTGSTLFTTPGFHTVVLSNFVSGAQREVKAYLDGALELTSDTDQLNLDNANNPGHLLNFFLDNVSGQAQTEFANGRIAFLQIYDGVLVVPEPSAFLLALIGLLHRTRKRGQASFIIAADRLNSRHASSQTHLPRRNGVPLSQSFSGPLDHL